MVKEIAFENGRTSNFEGLVTLTLTLDRVILHTVVHHSSTCAYMPNFIKIKETFVDGRTYIWRDRHLRSTLLGRLRRVVLKSPKNLTNITMALASERAHKGSDTLLSAVPWDTFEGDICRICSIPVHECLPHSSPAAAWGRWMNSPPWQDGDAAFCQTLIIIIIIII